MHTTSADHSLSSEKCVHLYRPACHTIEPALAGWLSWLERFSTHRKTAVLIPGQDPCLSCGLIPRSGVYDPGWVRIVHTGGSQSVLLSLIDAFLSPFLCL